MSNLGHQDRPLRVAIVGSGPSGFYAADSLLRSNIFVQTDLYERLPTPFGLVRYGVAPDHAKIKNVTRSYERVASDKAFRFLGNVAVGRDISIAEMRQFYDAVILTVGCQADRHLDVPGENLPGSGTATAFVAWYNGHPDYQHLQFDLRGDTAMVIGQGNVAVDVVRILGKTPDELRTTDITDAALEALAESRVRDIHMVGRRGPAQAAFTEPEIKELAEMANCEVLVSPEECELDPLSREQIEHPDFTRNRNNYEILKQYAHHTVASKQRRLHIRFLRSPKALEGDGRLERVVLERNELTGDPTNIRASGTGETETIPCTLLFRSVGYRGVGLPGVPFDDKRGIIPNSQGRVLDGDDPVPGLYCAGWIKRGPSGLIGTNRPCSLGTVQSLIQDLKSLTPCPEPGVEAAPDLLRGRGVRVVSFDEWRKIDRAETERGANKGKPREKFTRVEDMLAVLA